MRKLSIFCAVCLLFVFCVSGASAASPRYVMGEFEADLPDGWYEYFTDGENVYYLGNTDFTLDDGMLVLKIGRSELLNEEALTDEFLTASFRAVLQTLSSQSADGTYHSMESRIAGKRSLVVWYTMEADGVTYAAAENMTVTGTATFEVSAIHPGMEPDELKDLVVSIGESVRYTPAGSTSSAEEGSAGISAEDLPRAENPYEFTPALTVGADLLAAQWMMDENTRALCSVYLTLDLVMDNTPLFQAFPMKIYESRIGLSGNTVRILVQSQDDQYAFIILYSPGEQTAQFHAEPWNESTLAAFEQACTDQFWTNAPDDLENASRQIMELFTEE